MRPLFVFLLVSFATALACGGETVIATNNELGGSAGTGAISGGSGGEAGETSAAGAATGGSGGEPVCEPGETQTLGACEKCGTETRTCDASGQWEPSVCGAQGDCNAGESVGGCGDPCEEQVCGQDCKLSGCQLKAGAACKWEGGLIPHCCGTDQWQYCSKITCQYFPCSPCKAGSTCFSAC